jgi:hypothetical protein
MSWSFTHEGTPEEVAAALDAQSERLSGQSKDEFDAALPHLKGLVAENFRSEPYRERYKVNAPIVNLSANGSGLAVDGEQQERSCQVTLSRK